MELNLDEEYYNKYIKYKKRYLMLRQLKNNNDLEGGWPWPISLILGTGETPVEVPQVPQAPSYGSKMYLVFTISADDLTNPLKLTQFTDLSLRTAMKRNMRQINTNNESDQGDQNINNETNDNKEKTFMKCDEFFKTYSDAYLLLQKDDKWYYRLLNKDTNKMTFSYEEVNSYLESIKIKIDGFPSKDDIQSKDDISSKDDIPSKDGTPQFIYGYKNKEDNTMNNEIISLINKEISIYVENNNKYLEDKTATFKETIKTNSKIRILETFVETQLPSNLDPNLVVPNEKFLVRFNNHFRSEPPQNMILEIKPYINGDIDFTYDNLSDITASNQTFLDIVVVISTKLAADTKEQDQKIAAKQAAIEKARSDARAASDADKARIQSPPSSPS